MASAGPFPHGRPSAGQLGGGNKCPQAVLPVLAPPGSGPVWLSQPHPGVQSLSSHTITWQPHSTGQGAASWHPTALPRRAVGQEGTEGHPGTAVSAGPTSRQAAAQGCGQWRPSKLTLGEAPGPSLRCGAAPVGSCAQETPTATFSPAALSGSGAPRPASSRKYETDSTQQRPE